jgi:hypothetical protein
MDPIVNVANVGLKHVMCLVIFLGCSAKSVRQRQKIFVCVSIVANVAIAMKLPNVVIDVVFGVVIGVVIDVVIGVVIDVVINVVVNVVINVVINVVVDLVVDVVNFWKLL